MTSRTLARHIVLVLGVLLAACGAGKAAPPKPNGTVAFVRGARGVNDQGGLVILALGTRAQNTLLDAVLSQSQIATTANGAEIIAVQAVGSSQNPGSEIVSIEPATGTRKDLGLGVDPTLSSTGSLAYCDEGHVMVVVNQTTGSRTDLGKFYASTGCGSLAWSPEGKLAVAARTAAISGQPSLASIYLFDVIEGSKTVVPLGDLTFARSLSWSADGKSISLVTNGPTVVVRTLSTGEETFRIGGDDAKFAPVHAGRVAVLERSEETNDIKLRVIEDGRSVAEHDFGQVLEPGFDWSPSGDQLVVALDDALGIWDLSTDSVVHLQIASQGDHIFSNVKWTSGR